MAGVLGVAPGPAGCPDTSSHPARPSLGRLPAWLREAPAGDRALGSCRRSQKARPAGLSEEEDLAAALCPETSSEQS